MKFILNLVVIVVLVQSLFSESKIDANNDFIAIGINGYGDNRYC
jgi:hypothetical protein